MKCKMEVASWKGKVELRRKFSPFSVSIFSLASPPTNYVGCMRVCQQVKQQLH